MSNVKAALRIVLYAEQVVVAESSDTRLWQRILGVINGNDAEEGEKKSHDPLLDNEGAQDENKDVEDEKKGRSKVVNNGAGPVAKFATDIGVATAEVQGACDPQSADPFLILDHDAWEAFKTQLGDRGAHAVAPAAAAATLLALWFKSSSGQANATQAQAQAVLKSINVRDTNAARGVRRSEWLQARAGGQIILNPAKITKARLFAKCFCTQDWTEWKAGK